VPVQYLRSGVAGLDPATLYKILRLRVQVFVVEQSAAYEELDGRDVEPDAELLWAEEDGVVLATARLLHDRDGLRIGRVATALEARGRGLASRIMDRALERCTELDPAAPIRLDAQAHLADWYGRFGFRIDGEPYVEDEIPHVPMTREGGSDS
jgi:ElaA protein